MTGGYPAGRVSRHVDGMEGKSSCWAARGLSYPFRNHEYPATLCRCRAAGPTEKTMWNVTVWTLIVCASVCTAGSLFLKPAQSGMRQVDTEEMLRRRRMVDVLQHHSRSFGDNPITEDLSVRAE